MPPAKAKVMTMTASLTVNQNILLQAALLAVSWLYFFLQKHHVVYLILFAVESTKLEFNSNIKLEFNLQS